MDEPYSQDTDGFATFFEAHYRQVIGLLTVVLGDRDMAADAAAEAFTRAVASWSRVSKMQSPHGWTYRVAINHGRRQARRRSIEGRLLASGALDADMAAIEGGSLEFWELLIHLPERQRLATVLRFGADLTEAEIAQVMGIRRSTVSSTLAAALRTIADSLPKSDEQLPRQGAPA